MTNMNRSEKGFFKGFLIAMLSTLFWIGVAIFVVVSLNGCAANVDAAQSSAEPVSTCSVATAEAGADLSQCSTTVLTVSVNPIVVTCLSASSRPPVSLVGNGVCEQGTSDRVWCCVPMPAVGL